MHGITWSIVTWYIDTCNDILVTGKKSPVYGKWKEFYFVIKYGEQKLLYYEREDVSSPLA